MNHETCDSCPLIVCNTASPLCVADRETKLAVAREQQRELERADARRTASRSYRDKNAAAVNERARMWHRTNRERSNENRRNSRKRIKQSA